MMQMTLIADVLNALCCLSAIMFIAHNDQYPLLFCRLKANAGSLTNFEVLDFLRSRGAKVDPMGCLGVVAASECKVISNALYLMLHCLSLLLMLFCA